MREHVLLVSVFAVHVSERNMFQLTGHLPMSQKVVQTQNRQFPQNLCQSGCHGVS